MVEKFLIDSNTFIEPYRKFYAFDLVPTYWDKLSRYSNTGRIIILDMVKTEIDKDINLVGRAGWVYNMQPY